MAHQRGEFRTDDQRERLDTAEFMFADRALQLTAGSVLADLDTLAGLAENVDLTAYGHSWGRIGLPEQVVNRIRSLVGW